MKILLGGGGKRRLKEVGVCKLFMTLEGMFIEGRRLKEGGHLSKDLP